MNRDLLQKYISEYKKKFDEIHREEIYKWQAVKQFQDSWDPDATDFAEMLSVSLSKTNNLMDSGYYYPRKMIVENAHNNPQAVKKAFLDLFDEDKELLGRIASFQTRIGELNASYKPGRKDYQDQRAVMVYLNLRYPDDYFFYKWRMFESFCEKLGCNFEPKMGSPSNIIQYHELCTIVREEVLLDDQLIKRHHERIGENEYSDKNYNTLTQDLIYAVTVHLDIGEVETEPRSTSLTIQQVILEPKQKNYRFEGQFSDYVSRQKRNKRIGDLGEEMVLKYEKANCDPQYVSLISHSSKTEGDGLGFDILSFDQDGNKKYIEVKTTKRGDEATPFYVSGAEFERSKKEGDNYYLYRLYNLDEDNLTADLFILQGDLRKFCINPTQYEVLLEA